MASKSAAAVSDPRALSKAIFDEAKRWWGWALVSKVAAFALGLVALWFRWFPELMPYVTAALLLLSELFQLRSDGLKGTAEGLAREVDMVESFGGAISAGKFRDLLADASRSTIKAANRLMASPPYFASSAPPGAQRATETTRESAWFTERLARNMSSLCFVLTAVLVVVAFVALAISVGTVRDFDTLSIFGRAATATLLFAFSFGLVRFAVGYQRLRDGARRVVAEGDRLIKAGNVQDSDARSLVHNYHLARATAPLIPTWLYNARQSQLNELWKSWGNQP
jgi:hypothetical protein